MLAVLQRRYWHDNLDPVEVRIEAYGLGRMAGQYGEKDIVQIPYDILEYLSEKYHLETADLIKPFVKGYLVGFSEKNRKAE